MFDAKFRATVEKVTALSKRIKKEEEAAIAIKLKLDFTSEMAAMMSPKAAALHDAMTGENAPNGNPKSVGFTISTASLKFNFYSGSEELELPEIDSIKAAVKLPTAEGGTELVMFLTLSFLPGVNAKRQYGWFASRQGDTVDLMATRMQAGLPGVD